jgi:hypothetical protein
LEKRPWLAAILSLWLVGAGQLYNRQLLKSLLLFLIFYVVGLALLVLYGLVGIWIDLNDQYPLLIAVFVVAWFLLWVYAVLDACWTAWALKKGRLIVRYSLRRQFAHLAAGWVPFAGELVPSETVRPDELDRSVGGAVVHATKQYLLKRLVIRVARYSCLIAGAVVIAVGLWLYLPSLATLGGVVLVAGLFLLLA